MKAIEFVPRRRDYIPQFVGIPLNDLPGMYRNYHLVSHLAGDVYHRMSFVRTDIIWKVCNESVW
jgi:hypothetical protein